MIDWEWCPGFPEALAVMRAVFHLLDPDDPAIARIAMATQRPWPRGLGLLVPSWRRWHE